MTRKPSTSTLAAQEKAFRALHGMYQLLPPVGEQSSESIHYKRLAEAIEAEPYLVQRIVTLLSKKGALERSFRGHIGDGRSGKSSFWKLTVPEEQAAQILKNDWYEMYTVPRRTSEAKRKNPEPTITADAIVIADERSTEEVRAIAGPDNKNSPFEVLRHMRRDESAAQVEAVRQYLNRTLLLEQKLGELAAAGITVNREAIVFDRDEHLETLSLLLPYIDQLEGRIRVQQETIESMQKRVSVSSELARENAKLREQNSRLISEKVALQGRMAS